MSSAGKFNKGGMLFAAFASSVWEVVTPIAINRLSDPECFCKRRTRLVRNGGTRDLEKYYCVVEKSGKQKLDHQ